RHDLLGPRLLRRDEPGDAVGDDLRLAGAGAGHDQERAFTVRRRLALLGMQSVEAQHLGRSNGSRAGLDRGHHSTHASTRSPAVSPWRRALHPLALAVLALASLPLAGCSPKRAPAHTATLWLAGHPLPAFDPDGPPDALRQALERQLSRGLVELDSAGVVRAALADSFGCSRDSLTWTFHLRAGARFTDGTRVTSADIRNALVGGLARDDHATRAWLLAAVRGVSGVRPGRALPALGIETAVEARLVLKLAVREPRLLEKLATPGTCTPWKRR